MILAGNLVVGYYACKIQPLCRSLWICFQKLLLFAILGPGNFGDPRWDISCFAIVLVLLSAILQTFWKIFYLTCCFCSWLRSSLWLQFKPHHIAAGAAYLAAKFLNLDLDSYKNIWQEFQATPDILQAVAQQLTELF
ncbi:hypothetical protein ACFX2H_012440 [Malus domestica]